MKLMVEVSAIAGTSSIGGINQPIISSRKIEHDIRLRDGETNILGGLMQRTEQFNVNGIPGLADLPLVKYLFASNDKELHTDEVLILMTPHIIRLPSISAENLRTIAAGTDTNVRVYRGAVAEPAAAPKPSGAESAPAGATPQANAGPAAQLRFDPANLKVKAGDTTTLGLSVSNVNDLYSIPLLIHFNPAVIQVEEVRDGRFLSGGTQDVAIVQRIDAQRGELVVSATRQPNTPGVNGSGTLIGIVVRGVAPGSSPLQVLQVNARDSRQQNIPMVSGEATIQVQ
jgi:general secretion pathway protein D